MEAGNRRTEFARKLELIYYFYFAKQRTLKHVIICNVQILEVINSKGEGVSRKSKVGRRKISIKIARKLHIKSKILQY